MPPKTALALTLAMFGGACGGTAASPPVDAGALADVPVLADVAVLPDLAVLPDVAVLADVAVLSDLAVAPDAVLVTDGGAAPDAQPFMHLPGWSVRARISTGRAELVLEEVLVGFAAATPGPARIRRLPAGGAEERSWTAPSGQSLSDFCSHPSGEISAILVATDGTVSLERLSPDLAPLGSAVMHDPLIATDPHVSSSGALDLRTSGLTWHGARIAAAAEAVVAAVATSWNSLIAYRTSFTGGAWTPLQRTLVEPPVALAPFLPIGGSFDTFEAMVVWFRPLLDIDEEGNAYLAIWAGPARVRAHGIQFDDASLPLAGVPGPSDSDVLVTKLDPAGARVWSRVVGTPHEDEPYALRARAGRVAIAGRARRFIGFDNRVWDAFVAVVSADGAFAAARALPLEDSGIVLAIDALPGGGWVLGGSDGWSQNPDGLSVLAFGHKLLAVLPTLDGALARIALPAGLRHSEIRAVVARPDRLLIGGHEDGPIMHTGDADPSLITANGLLGDLPAP